MDNKSEPGSAGIDIPQIIDSKWIIDEEAEEMRRAIGAFLRNPGAHKHTKTRQMFKDHLLNNASGRRLLEEALPKTLVRG